MKGSLDVATGSTADGTGSPHARTLVLVGAGKMGTAMLRGWLDHEPDGLDIHVYDPHPANYLVDLARRHTVVLNAGLADVPRPDVIVLATKPQAVDDAARVVRDLVRPGTLVISVLAGTKLDEIAARLPDAEAIIRAMPNLPAATGRGMTAAAPGRGVTDQHRRSADALFGRLGKVEWFEDEHLLDVAMALSSCGPAYVFYLIECLADSGVQEGLPRDAADRLARAVVEGAGEMLFRTSTPPAALRQDVTSPNGTTAAALAVLMAEDGLAPLIARTVSAARRRADELAS